jgi:predicted RNA-binding Zn ribbon-like protein
VELTPIGPPIFPRFWRFDDRYAGRVDREALLSGLVHPGGRAPAPGRLALVQGLVNTVDQEHGPDLLAEPGGLREWLDRRGLLEPDADVTAAALGSARELREALRALLLANNGEPEDPRARPALEAAAARAELRAAFPPEGPELVPQRAGVEGALGRVAAAAFVAMLDGSWSRLKACPRDRCGWAFYDRSSNASATWCSMAVCGGRVKSGAYYRRRRRAAGG